MQGIMLPRENQYCNMPRLKQRPSKFEMKPAEHTGKHVKWRHAPMTIRDNGHRQATSRHPSYLKGSSFPRFVFLISLCISSGYELPLPMTVSSQ
jgi:hypothetical protein